MLKSVSAPTIIGLCIAAAQLSCSAPQDGSAAPGAGSNGTGTQGSTTTSANGNGVNTGTSTAGTGTTAAGTGTTAAGTGTTATGTGTTATGTGTTATGTGTTATGTGTTGTGTTTTDGTTATTTDGTTATTDGTTTTDMTTTDGTTTTDMTTTDGTTTTDMTATGGGGDGSGYFTSGDWSGCTWTSTGEVAGTTIMPQDFTAIQPGQAYCASGSVAASPDYDGVAIVGFNLNEPADADCSYKPPGTELPVLDTITPTGSGIAVNFSKAVGSIVRIQIQGPNGADDANDRWCYELQEVEGAEFIPYDMFQLQCWPSAEQPDQWYAGQPLSAVSFTVPGSNEDAVAYDFCVSGFADGNSVADAPESLGGGGPISGTITEDFGRAKVTANGKSYIIQNNNWGPNAGEQVIDYAGNSFTVTTQTGGAGGGGEPASFPSIYIGSNGDSTGSYNTSMDDGLPIAISAIQSIPTTLVHNGTGGDYNVVYDVWFQPSNPAMGYDDASAAFLMLWFYRPGNRYPIDTDNNPDGTVNLEGYTWEVYQGPRGGGNNATVLNYVATSTITNASVDLKPFIDEAVANRGFQTSWVLSDIFAGFEIWSGGQGLQVQEFTAAVNP